MSTYSMGEPIESTPCQGMGAVRGSLVHLQLPAVPPGSNTCAQSVGTPAWADTMMNQQPWALPSGSSLSRRRQNQGRQWTPLYPCSRGTPGNRRRTLPRVREGFTGGVAGGESKYLTTCLSQSLTSQKGYQL